MQSVSEPLVRPNEDAAEGQDLACWQSAAFQPRRLRSDPGKAIRELEPSLDLLAALAYNVQYQECREYLSDLVQSNWLLNATPAFLEAKHPAILETWIVILHTGVQWEKMSRDYFSQMLPSVPNEYKSAFQRELGLINRNEIVDCLIEFGYEEILESEDRLSSEEELRYYIERLSERQKATLLSRWGAPNPDVLIDRVIPRGSGIGAWPEDPPGFRTAWSLWSWHNDFIVANGLEWAANWGDYEPQPNDGRLDKFLEAFRSLSTFSEERLHQLVGEQRTMILLAGSEPTFKVRLENEMRSSEQAISILKSRAGEHNWIFGQSLVSAGVYYERGEFRDHTRVAQRLVGGEMLPGPDERERYMARIGADLVILDPIRAATVGTGDTAVVLFPMPDFFSHAALRTAIMVTVLSLGKPVTQFASVRTPLPWLTEHFQGSGVPQSGRGNTAEWMVAL